MTAQTSRAPLQASSPLLRENVGSIAVLTLDSPKTRNALSEAMIAALHEAIVSIREEKSVRAVVIAAQGPAYSSGHDLKELTARRSDADKGRAYFSHMMKSCSEMMQAIVRLPKPVVAAVQVLQPQRAANWSRPAIWRSHPNRQRSARRASTSGSSARRRWLRYHVTCRANTPCICC